MLQYKQLQLHIHQANAMEYFYGHFCRYLSGAQLWIWLFELVPDGLKDGGERSDTDASTNQHADLVVKHVLTGCAKRSIYTHPEDEET